MTPLSLSSWNSRGAKEKNKHKLGQNRLLCPQIAPSFLILFPFLFFFCLLWVFPVCISSFHILSNLAPPVCLFLWYTFYRWHESATSSWQRIRNTSNKKYWMIVINDNKQNDASSANLSVSLTENWSSCLKQSALLILETRKIALNSNVQGIKKCCLCNVLLTTNCVKGDFFSISSHLICQTFCFPECL